MVSAVSRVSNCANDHERLLQRIFSILRNMASDLDVVHIIDQNWNNNLPI